LVRAEHLRMGNQRGKHSQGQGALRCILTWADVIRGLGKSRGKERGNRRRGYWARLRERGMMKRQTRFFGNTGVIIKHRVERGRAWQEVGPGLERGAFAGGIPHGVTVDRKSSGGWVDPCRKAHRRQRQW